MEQKEINLQEMQEECVKLSLEISKLESIKRKHLKRFDELSYKIWQKQKDNESQTTSENS